MTQAGALSDRPDEPGRGADYLTEEAAKERFLEIVQRQRGAHWVPSVAERRSIEHILDLTERHRLGVELAAARAGTISLSEVAVGVASHSPAIILDRISPNSNAEPRLLAPALTRCLLWTFTLLTDAQQNALIRLSVFPGSLTVQSASPICDLGDAAEYLTRFQELCLLEGWVSHEFQRYRLPADVRAFLWEKFVALQDAETVYKRFVLYYRHLVHLYGGKIEAKHTDRLAILDAELPNLLAAADYARARESWDSVRDFKEALRDYLHLREDNAAWERLVRLAYELSEASGDSLEKAQCLWDWSAARARQGDYAEAMSSLQRCLLCYREANHSSGEGRVLTQMGDLYAAQERWQEATECYLVGANLAEETGDRSEQARVLERIGDAFRHRRMWDEAIKAYESGVQRRKALGMEDETGQILLNLGEVYARLYRWSDAERVYRERRALAQRQNDPAAEALALNNLGVALERLGRQSEAIEAFSQSLILKRDLQDAPGEAQTLLNLGLAHQAQGNWRDAEDCYQHCLTLLRSLGEARLEGDALNNLGIIYLRQRRYEEAEDAFRACLQVAREAQDQLREGQAMGNLGGLFQAQARWSEAEESYLRCLAICRSFGDRLAEGKTIENLALLLAAQGDLHDALIYERKALEALERTTDIQAQDRARRLIAQWESRLT